MRNKKSWPYVIFGVLAILLFIILFLVKPQSMTSEEFLYDCLLNFAFVFFTIVVVNVTWFFLGGDPVENMFKDGLSAYALYSDGFDTGLLRAHSSSSAHATTSQWIELLRNAESSVDLMGYSLRTWTQSNEFTDALVMLAKKGVQVRILIMSKDNGHFHAGLNTKDVLVAKQTGSDVDVCVGCVQNALNILPADKRDNIKITLANNGFIEMQIVRIDQTLYVTPYMYSINTGDSPLFVCKKQEKGYFNKYSKEFDTLWNMNQVAEK